MLPGSNNNLGEKRENGGEIGGEEVKVLTKLGGSGAAVAAAVANFGQFLDWRQQGVRRGEEILEETTKGSACAPGPACLAEKSGGSRRLRWPAWPRSSRLSRRISEIAVIERGAVGGAKKVSAETASHGARRVDLLNASFFLSSRRIRGVNSNQRGQTNGAAAAAAGSAFGGLVGNGNTSRGPFDADDDSPYGAGKSTYASENAEDAFSHGSLGRVDQ